MRRVLGGIAPIQLAHLMRDGNPLFIPTNAGWTEVLVGSGTSNLSPFSLDVRTGTTASSSALRQTQSLNGIHPGAGGYSAINYDKKLLLVFSLARANSDAQAVGRTQLKRAATIGALADLGLGVREDNLVLVGESYGSALGELDLSYTLTDATPVRIAIFHNPTVPSIQFYVNWVLKDTQTTATKIPSGVAATDNFLVRSIANGITGGVNALGFLSNIWGWIEP